MSRFVLLTPQLRNLLVSRVLTPQKTPLLSKKTGMQALMFGTYRQSNAYHTNRQNVNGNKVSKVSSSALLLGCFILGGVGLGVEWYLSQNKNEVEETISNLGFPILQAAIPNEPPGDVPKTGSRRKLFNFISEVVQTCGPSVVYIEIVDTRSKRVTSNGSGFVVGEDGLILTNAHVVSSQVRNKVQVKLQDGRTYVGQVVNADMSSDLALVRIPCRKLPVIKLGVSSDLEAGEWVVAIGSPLSLSNTVTAGVVSSTNRKGTELGLQGRGIDYIQTDASITFGNSGGPLVNLDGEVIGINAMKITAGISFAIPIDYAKIFLEKNKESTSPKGWFGSTNGKTHRRYMGITMVTLTPPLLLEMQQRDWFSSLDVTHGVLVVKVVVDSPAHVGGLQPGDIVTHINGQPVQDATNIYAALESTQCLEMTLVRGKETINVIVVPED